MGRKVKATRPLLRVSDNTKHPVVVKKVYYTLKDLNPRMLESALRLANSRTERITVQGPNKYEVYPARVDLIGEIV